jgi:hypothetical protein
MSTTISSRVWTTVFIVFSCLAICISLLTVQTTGFNKHSDLFSLAVTFDITISIPLVYYFLVVRKSKTLPFTIIVVFLLCTFIAAWILPADNHYYLDKVEKLLALGELFILIYAIIRIRKIVVSYKKLSLHLHDFVHNLSKATIAVFGRSAIMPLLLGEINTVRYGLLFWWGKKEILPGQESYTVYKKTGYTSLWGVLCFVMLIEITAFHFLILQWSKMAAIIVTSLSIYTFIFAIADLAAVLKRPVVFNDGMLYLRIGVRWNVELDPAQISSIEKIRNFKKDPKHILNCSLTGNPNILIKLQKPVTVYGYYGIKRIADQIVLNIDNEADFLDAVNSRISG